MLNTERDDQSITIAFKHPSTSKEKLVDPATRKAKLADLASAFTSREAKKHKKQVENIMKESRKELITNLKQSISTNLKQSISDRDMEKVKMSIINIKKYDTHMELLKEEIMEGDIIDEQYIMLGNYQGINNKINSKRKR